MSSDQTAATKSQDITDLLLYVGAAVIVGIGVTWLLMTKPWVEEEGAARRPAASSALQATGNESGRGLVSVARTEVATENPLRVARLAQDAGMLIEPERFSAWTLYGEILDADPQNVAATNGLNEVADALVERATTAFEQGRTNDANAMLTRIRARLPAHAGALALAEMIGSAERSAEEIERQTRTAAAEAVRPRAPTPQIAAPTVNQTAPAAAAARPATIDPIPGLRAAFDKAMAADVLIRPSGESAKHYLDEMTAANAEHARTVEARELLFAALLERVGESTLGLDEVAAETWIDEAASLEVDPTRIQQARDALFDRLAAAESARLVPVAELDVVDYTPPRYPVRAIRRNVEGWVDLEFSVGLDGRPSDVTVTEASHETLFRDEAVEAVESWRFEPRTFRGRPIEQRAYARVRFALE